MADIDRATPVGTLVSEHPEYSRIFEELLIDYCCHGHIRLEDACRERDLDPDHVVQRLERAEGPAPDTRNWSAAPLTELCDHIEQTHHAYLRKELPRLDQLTAKVAEVHGARHTELGEVKTVFGGLQAELMPHMLKEEQVLFPAIRQLEAASDELDLPFGTVQNPIRVMEHEHDVAGGALRELHKLTGGYQIPRDACNTYCAMLQGLHELELDLHQHIHKENNILFPRAAQREAALHG